MLEASTQGSLGVPGEAGGSPSCQVLQWKPRWQVAFLCAPRYQPVWSSPGLCQCPLGNSDLWFHSWAAEKVTTSPLSLVRVMLFPGCSRGREGGREPEHLHPLAKDHEEMFNWHLEFSSVAGWGSQALLHPMETSPQFSLQFLESSPPNPWVQCGILTETSAHHLWNSLS